MTPAPPSRSRSGEARRERRSRETRPLLRALLKRWSMNRGDHELASSELSRWSVRQVPFFRTLRQDGTAACYLQGNHLTYLTTCPPAEVCSLRIRRQPNAGGRQASSECR